MILRPYQERLVNNALKALESHNDTLAVASTGSGKTICLAALAGKLGGKQLVLQHRQELVSQNMNKFQLVNPDRVCGLWTATTKNFSGETTFAMVQSLEKHVEKMPKLDVLIADEAHHCAAKTWKKIITSAKDKNPDLKVIGFTATPSRSDWRGLRSIFSNVCEQISTRELIAHGFLVPYRTYAVDVGGTLDALKGLEEQSDFGDQSDVEQILNTTPVNDEIIRNWREYADGRPTVVFAATVKHAQNVAKAFSDAGVPAECVHGEMPVAKRKHILDRMSNGEIKIITNAMVLTEGWDYQPVSCVILLRKCSDKGPLIQMVGRGLRTVDPRLYPGIVKKDCIVLDFGASLLTHQSLEADVELKDDREPTDAEGSKKTCPECGLEVPVQTRVCPFCGFIFTEPEEESESTTIELTEIDLLNRSKWRYEDLFGTGACFMASGFNAWAGIFSADGENWYAMGREAEKRKVETIVVGSRLMALAAADDFLRLHETEKGAIKTRHWLDEAASEGQMRILSSYGYGLGLTKYAASCHINFQFARRQIERALGVAS